MYKPPKNSNRVKSITSKFEEIENRKQTNTSGPLTPGLRNKVPKSEPLVEASNKQVLTRQLSDPLKRNIKRTPAFRLDKNSERNSQINVNNRNTLFENKIKQFNNVVKSCNTSGSNIGEKTCMISDPKEADNTKPILIKSKSSHDFQLMRTNKNNYCTRQTLNETQDSDDIACKGLDLSLVYTEPIPKSFRCANNKNRFVEQPKFEIDNIYSKSTLKLTDKNELLECLKSNLVRDLPAGLTDSLKCALAKPLPSGPAPRKPPRTFQHESDVPSSHDLEKNTSFLHVKRDEEENITCKTINKQNTIPVKKSDPKYMLNKLEHALKSNKLRVRKQEKVDISTTSGEDSDDSVLFRSKSSRSLSKLTKNNQKMQTKISKPSSETLLSDLNCFNGLSCTNPPYKRIKEPSSSFFVTHNNTEEEPVYAEPCHFQNHCSQQNSSEKRNSLYYMSTSLLNENSGITNSNPNQLSAENSSLSSYTSDVDSTPVILDDAHAKIRHLIEAFETRKRQNSLKCQRSKDCRNNNMESSETFEVIESNCNQSKDICNNEESTSRIELLKSSLKLTLNNSFLNENVQNGPNSDSEEGEGKVLNIIKKFETYQKNAPKYCQPNVNDNKLFYCCLIIEKVNDCARIKFKYPDHVEIPQEIEQLCFPENPNYHSLNCSDTAQTYSLLITNQKGERMFGYCRRVLPEGSTHCLPLAYCILSKYRSPRFYKNILMELESRHGIQDRRRNAMITQFYNNKFPKPGESITINLSRIEPTLQTNDNGKFEESLDLTSFINVKKSGEYGDINKLKTGDWIFISDSHVKESCAAPSFVVYEEQKTELVITLHFDTRYEDNDLRPLHNLPSDILLKVFSSLLLERKVIFISSVISKLSSCVDSLQSILYPFTWYHTLIPILPESLWDIVESPTPVICGVLSEEAITERRIENGIVVNLDTNTVLIEEGDEMKILSGSMQKVWKRGLALASKAATSMDYVQSVYLANAYLQIFICCLKNYRDFLVDGSFLKAEFLSNAKTKGIRRFLKMFTETCMFHAFIDAALNNPESLSDFDKKIEMYGSDECNVVLDKLLEWNR